MNADRYRVDWITRRRYFGYLAVVSLLGGGIGGYLLGGEHTLAAVAVLGLTGLALVVPKLLAERPLFDERDRRMDERAARYTMWLVFGLSIPLLVVPIVLEQLGIVPLQGWALGLGAVFIGLVYVYVAIVLVLNYRA